MLPNHKQADEGLAQVWKGHSDHWPEQRRRTEELEKQKPVWMPAINNALNINR